MHMSENGFLVYISYSYDLWNGGSYIWELVEYEGMEEITPTVDELQKQIAELTATEESRMKAQQAQTEQIQQQLQSVTGASISTMGQIEQLKTVLADQLRERHQLEGMLRATMNQR